MAAWLYPAFKAILPHVSTIISAAAPAFTLRKAGEAAAAQANLVQQQIVELQAAASRNAEFIRELAEQLEKTVAALEQGAAAVEASQRRASLLSMVAIAMSLVSMFVALFVVFNR